MAANDATSVANFLNEDNWTPISKPVDPTPCDDGGLICVICFNNPPHNLTSALARALQEIQGPGITHGIPFDNGNITLYLRSTAP